jgi:hypothetical protein
MYALRLAFGALLMGLLIASGSLAFESDLVRGVTGGDRVLAAQTDPEEKRFERQVEKGDCWTAAGDATGYPTRMWVLKGDTYTEITAQARVDRAVEGKGGARVAAFCDGVDLTGL